MKQILVCVCVCGPQALQWNNSQTAAAAAAYPTQKQKSTVGHTDSHRHADMRHTVLEGTQEQERHQNRANTSRDHREAVCAQTASRSPDSTFWGASRLFLRCIGALAPAPQPGDQSSCAYSVVAPAQNAQLVSSRLGDQACAGVLRSGQTGWAMRAHSGSAREPITVASAPTALGRARPCCKAAFKKKGIPQPWPWPPN
eukprot:scaffold4035_cov132-Isochrysis_galbana.AAC.6